MTNDGALSESTIGHGISSQFVPRGISERNRCKVNCTEVHRQVIVSVIMTARQHGIHSLTIHALALHVAFMDPRI